MEGQNIIPEKVVGPPSVNKYQFHFQSSVPFSITQPLFLARLRRPPGWSDYSTRRRLSFSFSNPVTRLGMVSPWHRHAGPLPPSGARMHRQSFALSSRPNRRLQPSTAGGESHHSGQESGLTDMVGSGDEPGVRCFPSRSIAASPGFAA